MSIMDVAAEYFGAPYLVAAAIWALFFYDVLLVGISKWAKRWGRDSTKWVLLVYFFRRL